MIVKNCPALIGEKSCISSQTNNIECSKGKDCIMKQLIEKYPNIAKLLEVKR